MPKYLDLPGGHSLEVFGVERDADGLALVSCACGRGARVMTLRLWSNCRVLLLTLFARDSMSSCAAAGAQWNLRPFPSRSAGVDGVYEVRTTSRRTWSTRLRALSLMRLPRQLGHAALALHEKGDGGYNGEQMLSEQ